MSVRDVMPDLPPEVSTEEASRILGVSKDTVLRLKRAGLLEYRNAAPPISSRPVYRFALASVQLLRTTYTRDVADVPRRDAARRRAIHQHRTKAKYIRIAED